MGFLTLYIFIDTWLINSTYKRSTASAHNAFGHGGASEDHGDSDDDGDCDDDAATPGVGGYAARALQAALVVSLTAE